MGRDASEVQIATLSHVGTRIRTIGAAGGAGAVN